MIKLRLLRNVVVNLCEKIIVNYLRYGGESSVIGKSEMRSDKCFLFVKGVTNIRKNGNEVTKFSSQYDNTL